LLGHQHSLSEDVAGSDSQINQF